ncbi:hypothetical protein QL285_047766 [Trifolium repens]|nr:hypothetical protein QL285_047766 [Trifolium repens]
MGSFKIRVNLSKFHKNASKEKPLVQEEDRPRRTASQQVQDGWSFRNALSENRAVAVVKHDGRQQGVVEVAPPTSNIVWEVEEEEEVKTRLRGAYVGYLTEEKDPMLLQNNFRMAGFENLTVCALGFMKVLLWSDKEEEVKTVIQSVGWWCSLFERLVPWSPDLISNHRATWLRCFGVPLHAWGTDLFRSLAFKFGRFVEVDDATKSMRRCDIARIKVVTGEKRLIDSFMAVSVKGVRFDIRVIEEVVDVAEPRLRVDVNAGGRDDDTSSKASYGGGASVAAVVEGCSESGSDADVSDSCQVMLSLQKHGGVSRKVDGCLGVDKALQKGMSDGFPHNLGKHGDVEQERVNSEVDKSTYPMPLEYAEVSKVLGKAVDGSLSSTDTRGQNSNGLLPGDNVGVEKNKEDTLDACGGLVQFISDGPTDEELVGNEELQGGCVGQIWGEEECFEKNKDLEDETCVGPGQGVGHNTGPVCGRVVERGGCEEQGRGVIGPKVLRTRSGDRFVNGSGPCDRVLNTSSDSIECGEGDSYEGDPIIEVGGGKEPDNMNHLVGTRTRHKSVTRKQICNRNNTNLPLSMLRKLPGAIHAKRKCSNKKKSSKGGGSSSEAATSSDPIQGSENEDDALVSEEDDSAGSEQEEVVPCSVVEVEPISSSYQGREVYGDGAIMATTAANRETCEAEKLIQIGKEIGIVFQGAEGEDVDRMKEMEVRDRAEKEEWERTMGYQ